MLQTKNSDRRSEFFHALDFIRLYYLLLCLYCRLNGCCLIRRDKAFAGHEIKYLAAVFFIKELDGILEKIRGVLLAQLFAAVDFKKSLTVMLLKSISLLL